MNRIFDVTTTDIPFYDRLLKNGKGYERGNTEVIAKVVYMTPNDYFKQCAEFNQSTVEEQHKMINEKNMQELMKVVENEQLPIGFLNYVIKGQEGRHRALLARRLGVNTIPVLVIKSIH